MLPDDYGECQICGTPMYGCGGTCEACSRSHETCSACGDIIYYGDLVKRDGADGFLCEMCHESDVFEFTRELEMSLEEEKS